MRRTSEQASLDGDIDAPIEDDEDTEQRPAIKILAAEVPLAPLATVSLNGHDTHQVEVVKAEGENLAVPTMITYDPENAVEIGDQESIDNDTALKTVQVVEEQVEVVANSTREDSDSEIDYRSRRRGSGSRRAM